MLDTNVLSEAMRPSPAWPVQTWLARQPRGTLFVTSLSQAEIFLGIAILPEGERKRHLLTRAQLMFTDQFAAGMLDFSSATTPVFAEIVARRRQSGKPIGTIDAMIAAITATHGATLATRDRDFADCGIPLVDPWTS